MIPSLVLCAVVSGRSPVEQPAEAIERVIKANSNQLCAKGKISLLVKSSQDSLKVNTDFQYLSPNKVYIRQDSLGKSRRYTLLVSDGKSFVYSPQQLTQVPAKTDFIAEPVRDAKGDLLVVRDMYTVAQTFFIDRSIPLDIVMGRVDNSMHLSKILTDLKFGEDVVVGEEKLKTINGLMRVDYNSPAAIPFQMVIGENKIYQMVTKESFVDDSKRTQIITFNWTVDYALNDEKVLDEKLFVLPQPGR